MSIPQAPSTAAYNLLTLQTNRTQRRFAFLVGAIVSLISLLSVPYARVKLTELQAYQPAIFSTVICFEIITVFVLYSQFRVSRSPSILALTAGYLFSGGMSLMYLLTFPGIFAPTGLFHAGLQTAPWLYLIWHLGFPLSIGTHIWMESKYENVQLSLRKARQASVYTFGGVFVLISAITTVSTSLHDRLPVLLREGRLTPLFQYVIGWPIVLLSVVLLIAYYRKTRGSTVMASWLSVALLASLLDVVVVLCGGSRFSVGWYVAKWNTFVCANIVLAGMIYEFTKMYISMTDLYRKVTDSESKLKVLFSESQMAERKISEQNKIIERMLESSQEGIVMCDNEGRVIFANQRLEQMFERPLLNGQQLSDYCWNMKAPYRTLAEIIDDYYSQQSRPFRERVSIVTKNEEKRHYECYVNPIADADKANGILHGHLFGFGDRTNEERLAYYDELTGVPNRRFLGERLMEALERSKGKMISLSVYFIDLDGFKKVNDSLGHEMGDRLLQEVAKRLLDCVVDQGICARWAGDEFVVMLENIDNNAQLKEIAGNIIRSIQEINDIDGISLSVTASIGIAVYPNDGADGKSLLKHADLAMYEAKVRGKNNMYFYSETVH